MRAALLTMGLVLAGCGGTVDATHYDQHCAQDADCAPVHSGDVCAVCGCANAAVNVADQARFEADVKALEAWCGPRPKVLCAPCQQPGAQCTGGSCVFKAL